MTAPTPPARKAEEPTAEPLFIWLRLWGAVSYTVHGNHTDDHPDNLRVLPGPRAHALLHWYERCEVKGVQHLFGLDEWLELRNPK